MITVTGVLGKQGRSVAHTLLASGRYRVRGITRRIDSPEALGLAAQGMELVSIPLALGNQNAFRDAFRGSEGVFLLTPNTAPPASHEFELGREMADAAVDAGVRHIVFSSLENVDQISGGKLFAPHFTDKARIETYIRALPVVSSFIYMAFFYTNLMEFYKPAVQGDTLVFPIYLPENFRAPFVDPLTATGPAVLALLTNPEKYAGKSLPVIGDIISPREMVDTFTRVTGRKAAYSSAFSAEEFLTHFPGFASNEELVREISGMVAYAFRHGYYREHRDLQWSRRIDPNALTWEQFLRVTGWKGDNNILGDLEASA